MSVSAPWGSRGRRWWLPPTSRSPSRTRAACPSASTRSACPRGARPRVSTPTAASSFVAIRSGSPTTTAARESNERPARASRRRRDARGAPEHAGERRRDRLARARRRRLPLGRSLHGARRGLSPGRRARRADAAGRPRDDQRQLPLLAGGDRAGRSLFALANREIDLRLHEVYAGLPGYSMGRFGEATSRTDEVV